MEENELPRLGVDDFCRRFELRSASLMWFLGAGASAAAGISTAFDMIWDFKQRLYVSQKRVSAKSVADLSSASIRAQLQGHIDSLGTLPATGTPNEYAEIFETVYPAEVDRRAYLDTQISGARPSYGHIALATLMKANFARLLWTTNFDPLVADACAKVFETTGALTTGTLDAPGIAAQAITTERWPVEVKLHGDFRSRRLKNTTDELRRQDELFRTLLVDCCRRFGLIVVGYSGRDASVMESLERALEEGTPFPNGLFWVTRASDPVLERVGVFLRAARSRGVDVALVEVANFDELLRDLVRLVPDLDTSVLDAAAHERRHRTPATSPAGSQGWPVLRMNALPITELPTVCRRIECEVGGTADTRDAIGRAGANAVAVRAKAGVLAFGSDADLRKAFQPYAIRNFDLHSIEKHRLRYDSAERGLLRDALAKAITRNRGLDVSRRRNRDLYTPSDPSHATWKPLISLVEAIAGTVNGDPDLRWREGIAVRMEWASDQLWLVMDPKTIFDDLDRSKAPIAADFARERTVKRYNRQLDQLVSFWTRHLFGDGLQMASLGVTTGVDAAFGLSGATGFSWRIGA